MMMAVLICLVVKHDPWLLALALVVCVLGAVAALRLFGRAVACETSGGERLAWLFLTSVVAGAEIWCTHFVAMLAFLAEAPVGFDPVLTAISLLIAIGGASAGFSIAAMGSGRRSGWVGGVVLGLTVAAMHYVGMLAYTIDGIATWNLAYVVASCLVAAVFGGLSLAAARGVVPQIATGGAATFFVAGTVSLHFTAMTALEIAPATPRQPDFAGGAVVMAVVTALVALVVIAVGAFSWVIDSRMRGERDRQISAMATTDLLTGLFNRASFEEHLVGNIAWAEEAGAHVAVISIDMDRFDTINDSYGHLFGDLVLRAVAERLATDGQHDERVARLGGDEFAALKRYSGCDELTEFLTRLRKAVSSPLEIEGIRVEIAASLGVAIYPEDSRSADTLVNNAGLARQRATSETPLCFYDGGVDEVVRKQRALASDLKLALARGQIGLAYQAQTSLVDGSLIGYESLARWNHPVRGMISPGEFIPAAEKHGLIGALGDWVLRRACEDAARWSGSYKVAVNVSPYQLAESDLSARVHQALLDTGLPPWRLEIELTESAIMGDRAQALHALRQIKALGVAIALDDFGTGYSSLEVLGSFPFDKIKLDRCFVAQIERSGQALGIVRAVLAIGRTLGIPVLAEGIETPAQYAILRAEGCAMGQGYLMGKPTAYPQDPQQPEAPRRTA